MEKSQAFEIEEILSRLLSAYSVDTPYQYVKLTGFSKTSFNNWRTKKGPPLDAIVKAHFDTGKSISWLMYGTEMLKQSQLDSLPVDNFKASFENAIVMGIQSDVIKKGDSFSETGISLLSNVMYNSLASSSDDLGQGGAKLESLK